MATLACASAADELPYVEVRGDASLPTLLVIPGGGGSSLRTVEELERLETHFRVVHYDPCGVGKSDCPRRDTWQEMIDDVVAVAQVHHPRYLLGHSSGCLVANHVARAMPIDGALCVGPVFDFALTEASVDACLKDKLATTQYVVDRIPWIVRTALRFSLCGTTCGQRRPAATALLTCDNFVNREGVLYSWQVAAQRWRVRHDYTRQRLPETFAMPVRIVVGADDRITAPEDVVAHAPPGVPVRVVPDASHALPWEAPDVVLEEALVMRHA